MKNRSALLITLLITSSLFLSACQQDAEVVSEEPEEEPGKLIVHQILPDGSKEEIMVIGGQETAQPSIVEGTKGMLLTEEGFKPAICLLM